MEEKTIKKIIGAIIIVLVFALLLTGIGCNWTYVWGSMTGQQFYTEQQYNDNYNDGYNKGYDKGFGQYKPLIEQLSEVENLLNESQTKVNELTESEKVKTARITELETSIESKNARIKELESKGVTDEQTILTLRKEVEDLTLERDNLLSEKTELQTTIENLNAQILTLQNEVTRLTGLISSYEEIANGTHEVSFYNSETLLAVKAVKNGETIDSLLIPSYNFIDGREFLGWSIDGKNLVNVSEQVITENTIFNAVLGNYFWHETLKNKVGQEIDSLNSFVYLQDDCFTLLVKSVDNKKLYVFDINDLNADGLLSISDLSGLKEEYKTFNKASEIISASRVDWVDNSEFVYLEVFEPNSERKVFVNVYTVFEDRVLFKNYCCVVNLDKFNSQSDSLERAILVALGVADYSGYSYFDCGTSKEFLKTNCY